MYEKHNGGPSGWSEMNKEIGSDAESENLCSVSEGANISFTTDSTALTRSRDRSRSLKEMLAAFRSRERANTTQLPVLRSYTTVCPGVDRHLPLSRGAEF